MFNKAAAEGRPMELPALSSAHSDIYTERTDDRRRTERLSDPRLVAYYWDGGAPRAHDIRDISPTGFYLLTEERWYPGTQVMILLQRMGDAETDPERSITVNAEVVRFGKDGIGFALAAPAEQTSRGSEGFRANGADRAAFYNFLQRLDQSQS
jgi:hypothetical protein